MTETPLPSAAIHAAVLEHLDAAFRAVRVGDRAAFERSRDAAAELDPFCLAAIVCGIIAGEIPDPRKDLDRWDEYVDITYATARREGSAR